LRDCPSGAVLDTRVSTGHREERAVSTITVAEILHDPAGLVRRVEAGEALAIVKDGQVLAEIKPSESPPLRQPRPYGLSAGKFVVPDDFDDPLPPEIIDEFYK
jgi:antitoxin (DNA-binding transcriptional repressor) of toxin-antitoxin stability system